jgi:transcriptional regulator with XRE-family HTH domain
MAKHGVHTPADLARKLKVKPQTAYKWWAGQTQNISAQDIFLIADRLEVSARWLAGQDVSPDQRLSLTPDLARALDVYNALPPQWQEYWISQGNDILNRLTLPPSTSRPFLKAPKC